MNAAELQTRLRRRPAPLLIGGELRESASGRTFTASNPATEERLAEVASATAADVDAAVAAARRAWPAWSRTTTRERKRLLGKVADLVDSHAEELALLESLDTGIPLTQTRGRHVPRALENFRYFAELPEHVPGETILSGDTHLNLVVREPVGVIGVLSPWNAPLALSTMRIAAALAFGNCVVGKPAEQAPLSASRLAELAVEADLPPGVWNLVQGPPTPAGEALVAHPGVDAIALTGGTATGRRVMEAAARTLKPLSLELGGKSPSLVFADCDWERALDGTLLGIFSNNGQQCLAGSRILVEAGAYEGFLDAFVARTARIRVGDPLDSATEVGPLVSQAHLERVRGFVDQGKSEGARLRTGGDRPPGFAKGHYIRPAVFDDAPSCLTREEIFGPVATFLRFDDEEEALALANDTAYGLAAYCWTRDGERAHRVARALRAGTVWINTPLFRDVRAPFGGVKQSGFGRDGGAWGLDFYTVAKTICLALKPPATPKLGERPAPTTEGARGTSD